MNELIPAKPKHKLKLGSLIIHDTYKPAIFYVGALDKENKQVTLTALDNQKITITTDIDDHLHIVGFLYPKQ